MTGCMRSSAPARSARFAPSRERSRSTRAMRADLTAFAGHPGGGAVYDVGCYVIHAARQLLGTEPLAVTANAQVSADHGDIDMMTSALVEFPDDVSLLLQCGMWAADEDTLRILGSRGRIEVPSAFFGAAGREGFSVQVDDDSRYEAVPNVDHYTLQADRLAAGRAARCTAAL